MFFITVNETHARELVNGGVLIELLLLIGKATHRNIFDIYLNTLTRIGHLFIRFGLIGWLCRSLRKQSQPFEDSIKALNAAGITTFAKSVPKLGKTELSDRRKTPIRGFPDGTSALRARFAGLPPNRTLVRIEVFFASGSPRQKSYFKARIRGQD